MCHAALPPHPPAPVPPAAAAPQLSIIVPVFNGLALTQAMLASLRPTLPPRLHWELLFVDDGSTDGTAAWLKQLGPPCRHLVNPTNLGFAATVNRGAAAARGERLLLLNNDVLLRPGWLEPLLDAHRRLGRRAGVVGNVQLRLPRGAVDHTGIRVNLKGKPEHDVRLPRLLRLRPRPVRRVPAVTGACLLVARDVFLAAGGFDERYRNGGEDVDLAFRLTSAGRRHLVALDSVIDHHVSASEGRKRHDELNTYRLALQWRDLLVREGARTWCRERLGQIWARPTAGAAGELLATLAYLGRLRRTPPAAAQVALHAALEVELARWRSLFPTPPG